MWSYKPPESGFFSEEERRQVEVLLEGILPGTEDAPGAMDVGAAEYLDRLLAMNAAEYYEIPKWRDLYREALGQVEAAAKAGYGGKSLSELAAEERRELVQKLEAGTLQGAEGIDQKTLFATLRSHCIEGCFADPRWGGNKDGAMWRWFGYLRKPEAYRRAT